MIDRKSIPLAEGSRWSRANRDQTTVRDASGDLIYIENGCLTLNNLETVQYSHAKDALAVITVAGRNPYAEALERLVAEIESARKTGNAFPQLLSSPELDTANKLLGRT